MGHRAAVNLLVKRKYQSHGQNRAALFTPLLDLQKVLNYTAEHCTSTTKSSAVYTTILLHKQYLFLHKLHASPPTTVIRRKCIKGRCIMFRTFSVVNTIIATKITDYQQTKYPFYTRRMNQNNMITNNTNKRSLFDSDQKKSTHNDFTATKIF